MNPEYERLLKCVSRVRTFTEFVPDVALVLGSGLGDFAESVEAVCTIDYKDIEGFPVSTVPYHAGRFVLGKVAGVNVVVMQGRVHYYEGYRVQDIVLPTRLMGMLGAKTLMLTNAAGGINPEFNAGDMMLITDHILSFFPNPLLGENIDELGPRFPDMSAVYKNSASGAVLKAAQSLGISLRQGVYAQLTGPSFETPAEIRMLSRLGVDAVGMSTACEAAAAHHMGMTVCGVSCITNKAAGLSATPLSHEEVAETADRTAPLFKALLRESIVNIAAAIKA